MSRKHIPLAILGLALVLGLASATVFLRQDASASPLAQSPTASSYWWSYAAKFVCGFQNADTAGAVGEPPVKPGNYATEINIHNYNYKEFNIYKKLVVLAGSQQDASGSIVPFVHREPDVARPTTFVKVLLGPDYATMDDCNAIWRMAAQVGQPLVPGALTIGYLVILSPLDLDVADVYTAEVYSPPTNFQNPTGISEDVVYVPGKRVYVPANTLPTGAQAELQQILKEQR